ncbi:MAG: polysaccharide deacetylase family protein [Bacteroidales bacterium]|jgi:chitin deacetylase|nr:polysaccharide deacetylase family protein [Bacteroidales bacterium]
MKTTISMRNNKTYKIVAFMLLIFLFLIGLYYLASSRKFQFFGEIYPKVNTRQKVIALTFDDGPSPKTDTVLTILNNNNIKATFFLTGNSLHHYFSETERIVALGHEIGNHTYSHKRLVFRSYKTIASEIEKTDSLIRKAGYKGDIHFRPPHAKKLLVLPYYLEQNDRKTILWDIEPESIDKISASSDLMAQYVVGNSKSGSIILLHPMYDWDNESINAIETIVNGLKNKGYEFKTVSELLEYDGK